MERVIMLNGWSNVLSALMGWMNMKYQSIPELTQEQHDATLRARKAYRYEPNPFWSQPYTPKSEIQLEAEKGLIIEGKVNETSN